MTLHTPRLSVAALAACAPAIALVTAGLLQSATGHEVIALPDWLIHPALVLGGLGAAVALAGAEAVRLSTERAADALTLHLTVRRRPLALGVLALTAVLAGVIGLYLVAENLLA